MGCGRVGTDRVAQGRQGAEWGAIWIDRGHRANKRQCNAGQGRPCRAVWDRAGLNGVKWTGCQQADGLQNPDQQGPV